MEPTEPRADPAEVPDVTAVSAAFPQLEILELIGQGGMGWVFKARQPKLERLVALKLLPASLAERDPAFSGRFEREGQLLARLHHPNIVAVHDSGRAGEFFYLLMEYVDGVNLRQAMRSSRFTPAQALAIVPHICDALQFAHEEGVLHRDIKPENILLDGKGRVKLADFGIAKVLGEGTERTQGTEGANRTPGEPSFASPSSFESLPSFTQNGSTLGTPNYMAPEQRDTPAEVDHRADIYSLGVVFYELLTGELPNGPLPQPSAKCEADPRVDAIVQQALQQERTRRQHSAGEMKTQVTQLSAALTPEEISVVTQLALSRRGFEYKSPRTLFGLPLLHVVAGFDPVTGKQRVARGIVAVGGRAHGWLALGGVAPGGVAIGGCAIGGLAIGGCAIGLVSIGGCALALLLGVGGFATGYLALGGSAVGVHIADSTHSATWLGEWVGQANQYIHQRAGFFFVAFNLVLLSLILLPLFITKWAQKQVGDLGSATSQGLVHRAKAKFRPRKFLYTLGLALGIALFLRAFVIQAFTMPNNSAAPEIPKGSLVLAWKLRNNYAPGDFIVYTLAEHYFIGKVIAVRETEIQVRRFGKDDWIVPRKEVWGRVIFNTRPNQLPVPATPEAGTPPSP